jgi:hypothetical protein
MNNAWRATLGKVQVPAAGGGPPTIESTSFGENVGGVGAVTVSHTITAANKIVVTVATAFGATPTEAERSVATCTWNGVGLDFVGEIDNGAGLVHAEIWQMDSPATGTHDLVVTLNGAVALNLVAGITGFLGAAAGVGTPSTNTGAGANPSVTVADSASNDIVVSVLSSGNAGAMSADGTELWEVEDTGGGDVDFSAQRQTAAGANTVLSWTSGAIDWAAIGVAVSPA